MQARAPLMIEHRLIEKMVALLRNALERIRSTGTADPLFVDAAIDFFRVYADRTHHGKEEEILFRRLDGRNLSEGDRRTMNELIDDHVYGRVLVQALVAANARYRNGETAALADIAAKIAALVDFYPKHIEKEDKFFFPLSRAYFTDEEDQALLAEFWEFDRKMIHEKYKAEIEALGG